MFFPIRDDNPTRTKPWVTYGLIALNVAVYVTVSMGESVGLYWLTAWYGLVPTRLLADPWGESVTAITSMFMHGSIMHLASNMWFLHIFGDNLEDVLGRVRYLVFYLLAGLVAAAAQVVTDAGSSIPMVGASGAIAGVIGGYMVLYPRAPILAFNTIPLLWLFMGIFLQLPAWVIAVVFFGQNVLMAYQFVGGAGSAGVAIFAHLGGFIAGLVLIRPMLGRRRIASRVWGGWHTARRRPPRHRR
jgi:membrane associated rhomboid family serine protease